MHIYIYCGSIVVKPLPNLNLGDTLTSPLTYLFPVDCPTGSNGLSCSGNGHCLPISEATSRYVRGVVVWSWLISCVLLLTRWYILCFSTPNLMANGNLFVSSVLGLAYHVANSRTPCPRPHTHTNAHLLTHALTQSHSLSHTHHHHHHTTSHPRTRCLSRPPQQQAMCTVTGMQI